MIRHQPQKEALAAAALVFLVTGICNIAVTLMARDGLRTELHNHLATIAAISANRTDGDLLQTITSPEQKGSHDYVRLLLPYLEILKADPHVRFIYTAVLKDGQPHFVTDSQYLETIGYVDENWRTHMLLEDHPEHTHGPSSPETLEKDESAGALEEYTDAPPAIVTTLTEQRASIEKEPYTDPWGTFVSAFAPVYNSKGEFVATVGVDVNASDFHTRLMRVWIAFAIGSFLSLILSSAVYVLVFRIRMDHAQDHRMRQKRLELMQVFNRQVQSISAELTQVGQAINELSGRLLLMVNNSSRNTTEASNVIRGATGKIDTIAMVCRQLVDAANGMKDTSTQAQETASESMTQIQSMGAASENLSSAASNISKIVGMITGITDRIDLLALNATIEAARAGEAGKGFAVVAEEVKMLSQQTATATKQINDYVAEMERATQIVVAAFTGVSEKMTSVRTKTETATGAIDKQKELIDLVAADIMDVSTNAAKVENSMKSIAAIADETELETQELYVAVSKLKQQNEALNNEVAGFLREIELLSPKRQATPR